jgi:hypothetical protein
MHHNNTDNIGDNGKREKEGGEGESGERWRGREGRAVFNKQRESDEEREREGERERERERAPSSWTLTVLQEIPHKHLA